MINSFQMPKIDNLKDNYTVEQVLKNLELYEKCYVVWSGTISNFEKSSDGFRCDLLVGSPDMKNIEGIIPLHFSSEPVPAIDESKPARVLGQVGIESGSLILSVKSLYQSPNGKLPPLR